MSDKIKNFIIDTDIGGDCDDAIALAMLNVACKKGKAKMIAATHCTNIRYGCACIKAINNFYGNSCAIGACKYGTSEWFQDIYAKQVAEKFCNEGYENFLDAQTVLLNALNSQPDQSVTVICIGPMTNIGDFLADPKQAELFNKKVCKMYIMGGHYLCEEQIKEYNISYNINATRNILSKYNSEIVFVDFEIGSLVKTGQKLSNMDNPVDYAFKVFGTNARQSWDPITVLYALEDHNHLFTQTPLGVLNIDNDGFMSFNEDEKGKHSFLRLNCKPEELTEIINNYLV